MSNETGRGIEEALADHGYSWYRAGASPGEYTDRKTSADEARAAILSAIAEKDRRIADLEAQVTKARKERDAYTADAEGYKDRLVLKVEETKRLREAAIGITDRLFAVYKDEYVEHCVRDEPESLLAQCHALRALAQPEDGS